MANPSLINGASTQNLSATSITVNAIGGVAAGDLLFGATWARANNQLGTPPSGWVLLQNAAFDYEACWWYKIATASEPGTYTWTSIASSAAQLFGAVFAFRNTDRRNPIHTSGDNYITHTSMVTAPLTLTRGPALIIQLDMTDNSSGIADAFPGTYSTLMNTVYSMFSVSLGSRGMSEPGVYGSESQANENGTHFCGGIAIMPRLYKQGVI